MIVKFKYDLAKDIENFFIVAANSKPGSYSPKMTKYESKYGAGLTPGNFRSFILEETKEQQLDLDLIAKQYQDGWDLINDEFFKRCNQLFSCTLPGNEIIAYLTLCDRCGYNILSNYFFVGAATNRPKWITIHELWHFYTWYAFGKELQELSPDKYYILKESLTVIINHEFKDWLDWYDVGKESHQEIRREIEKIWLQHKSLPVVVSSMKKRILSTDC